MRELLVEMRGSMSQADLAAACGVEGDEEARQQWASRRETGKTRLRLDDVKAWARACGYQAVLRFVPAGKSNVDTRMAKLSANDQRDLFRLLDVMGRLEPQARLLLTMLLDAAEAAPPAAPAPEQKTS